MNIDFHYYATYMAAWLAGFDEDEAIVIAHAAQYVDESDASMIDSQLEKLGVKPQPTVMSDGEYTKYYKIESMFSWKDSQLSEIQRAWMPFHFLPGNLGNEIGYQGVTSYGKIITTWKLDDKQRNKFKLMCNKNSKLAEFMINHTVAYYHNVEKNLQMIGLRMHVLADTWAHCYYIGTPAWYINDAGSTVSEFCDGSWHKLNFNILTSVGVPYIIGDNPASKEYTALGPMPTNQGIFYLGHGRMGHLPDYPYLHYRYAPQWLSANKGGSAEIEKDNTHEFMMAFNQMVYALKCIKNNKPFKVNTYDSSYEEEYKRIEDVLRLRKVDQSKDWNNLIGYLTGGGIIEFNKMFWLAIFKEAQDKKKTDYYLFNKAAELHVKCVESFLNSAGLSLQEGYTMQDTITECEAGAEIFVHTLLKEHNPKHLSTCLAYKTWNGDKYMVEIRGNVFYHYKEGKRSLCHTDDHIDYISCDGTKWRSTVKEGTFCHYREGNLQDKHSDQQIAYLTWDGNPYVSRYTILHQAQAVSM